MKTRTGHLFKRNGIYYVQWRINGKLFMRSTGKRNKKDAEARRTEIMQPFVAGDEIATLQNIAGRIEGKKAEIAKYEDEQNPPLLVEDAWKAYQTAGSRDDIAASTMTVYHCYWGMFTEWVKEKHREVVLLRDVTVDICGEYKEYFRIKNKTARTFNAHRAFLRSFFNVLAGRAKFPDGNPWAKIKRKREQSKGRRALTTDELMRVCRSAEGELRVLLSLGLYVGCRLGDAACMEWGNVDMVKRTVTYIPRKTANRKAKPLEPSKDLPPIPIHPELYGILNETPPGKRNGYILPGMAALYERGPSYVSETVQEHFENCGLKTTEKRRGAGVKRVVSCGFHSLRHSTVSFLREAGIAQSISQAVVGHSSADVHRLYTHHDEAAIERAIHMLPSVLNTAKPAALPAVIGDNPKLARPVPRMVEAEVIKKLVERLNGKNWKKIKTGLLERLT